MPGEFDPVALLETLRKYEVNFVVIGGFAAWIHGAPIVTMDLDLVYDSEKEHVQKLVSALDHLESRYRYHGDRVLVPRTSDLCSQEAAGHHLLSTRFGNLDLMRTVAGFGYSDLLADSEWIEIAETRSQFASLAKIIELKTAADRPKDRAALPTLISALRDSES